MTEMTRGNIIIVDSNRLFREGLIQLLLQARFVVSGDGKNLAEAIDTSAPSKPADVIILTLESGTAMEAGLDQIKLMRRELPSAKLLALAASLSSTEFLRAMRAGVDALLTSDISAGVLQASLDLVMQSQRILLAPIEHLLAAAEPRAEVEAAEPKKIKRVANRTPELTAPAQLRSDKTVPSAPRVTCHPTSSVPTIAERSDAHAPSSAQALSEREGQILLYLINGFSNKAIARELKIAETTVKVHVKGLMRKVRAVNRTQVAIWAMNHYFTPDQLVAQNVNPAIGSRPRMGFSSSIIVGQSGQPRSI